MRNKKFVITFASLKWALSSVGLERYLDRVEVTGSNPVVPTTSISTFLKLIHLFEARWKMSLVILFNPFRVEE